MLWQRAHLEGKRIHSRSLLEQIYWNSSGSCCMQVQWWFLLTQEAIRLYENKGWSVHKPFTVVPRWSSCLEVRLSQLWDCQIEEKEEKAREERIWGHAEREWRRNILLRELLSLLTVLYVFHVPRSSLFVFAPQGSFVYITSMVCMFHVITV